MSRQQLLEKAAVHKMEILITHSPDDYAAVLRRSEKVFNEDTAVGYEYSGSAAGRNIEKIHEKAAAAGHACSLEAAVHACLGQQARRGHVLVVSGFYVLHDLGGNDGTEPGVAAGSCETDGPLGAVALVRAFASHGIPVSLFCDPHNGPVLKAAYDAMLAYFDDLSPDVAAGLRQYSRCLPIATDGIAGLPDDPAFAALYHKTYPDGGAVPDPASLRCRALRSVLELVHACDQAWGGSTSPGPIDCLFALERLGAPYRNIRGRDLNAHTEPIDALWPLIVPPIGSSTAADLERYCAEAQIAPQDTEALRALAGMSEGVVSIGVGDGGNEVGMGKVVHLDGIADLSPGGDYVALSENGTYRSCDHVVLGTVSNWAGNAFEMAAYTLYPPVPEADYVRAMEASSCQLATLEDAILAAIMAPPYTCVDGVKSHQAHSVDGMLFDPAHRGLINDLWDLRLR